MAKLPKPFSRPSIEIAGPKKTWQKVRVDQLELGDLVAHFGKIESLQVEEDYYSPFGRILLVKLKAVDGTRALKRSDDIVEAFK